MATSTPPPNPSSTSSLIPMQKSNTTLASSPLKDFTPLNSSVFLYQPPSHSSQTPSQENDPDVIVLMGWMDGTPRHLSKYTTPYRQLFPSSPIIVVITTIRNAVFSRTHQNITRITPVLTYLSSLAKALSSTSDRPRDPRVLLHSFSNGGGYSSMLIFQQWKTMTGKSLDVKAMILDSSPGVPTMNRTIAAMSVSLPKNPILRFLGVLSLRVLYVVFIILYELSRRVDWVRRLRMVLNDEGVVRKEGTRRVYVYSEEDEMVDWRDVVSHAEEARGKGYMVSLERFEGSGHVGHMIVDGERYSGVVRAAWDGK